MAKILIVEDDEKIVTYLSELLLAVGHLAIAADSATRAMELLESESDFALLILDHHLGRDSGLNFLRDIRQRERFRMLPVIVCSGDTKAASVKSFLALNISGFVMKPFLADRLMAEIEHVFLSTEDPACTPREPIRTIRSFNLPHSAF